MKIHIDLKQNPYFVYINEEIESSFLNNFSKIVVLTNTTLHNLYKDELKNIIKAQYETIIINDGEEYKNFDSVNYILNSLFELKADRKTLLIGFGGGVITDITGFVASIYQRGIKSFYIPTTLLACVDAAVGGKTGINNNYGKNLIGSFYQPTAVYIFTDFFNTLNQKELSAAMSEVIKMAALFDMNFFEFLEKMDKKAFLDKCTDSDTLSFIVAKSIELKKNIVVKDEKEQNLRKSLNYGHTFAHVIEKQTNYNTYLHGEAVSIGISMINHLSLKLGLLNEEIVKRINNLLLEFKLPITFNITNVNNFYNDLFLDKKNEFSKICFVILKDFQNFEFFYDITTKDILDFLGDYK